MEPSIILVLSLLLLLHGLDPSTARGVRASKTKTKVNVDIPKRLPSDATAVLDKALASLSFETSCTCAHALIMYIHCKPAGRC